WNGFAKSWHLKASVFAGTVNGCVVNVTEYAAFGSAAASSTVTVPGGPSSLSTGGDPNGPGGPKGSTRATSAPASSAFVAASELLLAAAPPEPPQAHAPMTSPAGMMPHDRNLRPGLFFFNDPAPTDIYTLSLHDALPICFTEQGAKNVKKSASRAHAFDAAAKKACRSEEHTSELQSLTNLVCRLLLE